MYIYICRVYVYIYMYVLIYIYVVYIYVCIYICMHVHMHTQHVDHAPEPQLLNRIQISSGFYLHLNPEQLIETLSPKP